MTGLTSGIDGSVSIAAFVARPPPGTLKPSDVIDPSDLGYITPLSNDSLLLASS